MNKKSGFVIGLTLVSLLLCGCRRDGKKSTSIISSLTQTTTSQSGSSVSSITSSSTLTTSSTSPTTTHSSTSEPEPGDYYKTITDDLSGDELKTALHALNATKRTSTIGYDGLKTFLPKCDANPDNPSRMVGFYDNADLPNYWSGDWNREHTWPNSRGGGKVDGDAHMTRPTDSEINSGRGSKGYGTASYDPYTDPKITNHVKYYRGQAARIIFYCLIADNSLKICDDVYDKDYPYGADNTMATLSDMLQWNLDNLPTDTSLTGEEDLARRVELQRNEVIYSDPQGQGNRNPFIDHPSYACRIWGNYNSNTKKVCGIK